MSAADCFRPGCGIGVTGNADGTVNVFNDPDKLSGAIECIGDQLTVNALNLVDPDPCNMLRGTSTEELFVPQKGGFCSQVVVDGNSFPGPGTVLTTPTLGINNPASNCDPLHVFIHLSGNGSFYTFTENNTDQCFEAIMTLYEFTPALVDRGQTRIQDDNGTAGGELWGGTFTQSWASLVYVTTLAPGQTRNFFGRKNYLGAAATGGAACPNPPSSWSWGTMTLSQISVLQGETF